MTQTTVPTKVHCIRNPQNVGQFDSELDSQIYYPIAASFINLCSLICDLTNARKVEEMDITQQSALFRLFIYEDIDNEPSSEYWPFQEVRSRIRTITFDVNLWTVQHI